MLEGLRKNEFSSEELVSSCLQRLEESNPAINAITEYRPEEALAAARAADERGDTNRPLHGLPVIIKANVDVKGWATVNGCRALETNIAPGNSDCVQNWLNAGAIVMARSNTPEFCCRWETSNEVFGVTHNPWDRSRTPGGSSGGSAAAVASGIAPLAHGTDLGGSLRDPAQACGVASIKPGKGRVPCWNPTDPAHLGISQQLMNTDGPMARRVADLRLALQVMAGTNYHDPWWVPAPLAQSTEKPAVALVTNPAGGGINPQVAGGMALAGQLLEKAGYQVEEIEPPGIEEAAAIWREICIGDLLGHLLPAVSDICGQRLATMFEYYQALLPERSPEKYLDAFARRNVLLRKWLEFFEKFPLIVAPICTEPPLPTDTDQESAERVRQIVHNQRMTVAISALSLPAAVVPVGLEAGLPQSVQIIGPAFHEMDCLAAAEAIENQTANLTPIDPRQAPAD